MSWRRSQRRRPLRREARINGAAARPTGRACRRTGGARRYGRWPSGSESTTSALDSPSPHRRGPSRRPDRGRPTGPRGRSPRRPKWSTNSPPGPRAAGGGRGRRLRRQRPLPHRPGRSRFPVPDVALPGVAGTSDPCTTAAHQTGVVRRPRSLATPHTPYPVAARRRRVPRAQACRGPPRRIPPGPLNTVVPRRTARGGAHVHPSHITVPRTESPSTPCTTPSPSPPPSPPPSHSRPDLPPGCSSPRCPPRDASHRRRRTRC